GGQVAFIAKPVGKQDSLYVWQDGGIRLIVEGTESAGGSGPFENLNSVAVSEDGDLAFVGYSALYVQSGEQRQQVLSTMDFLQGKRVKGIYLGPSGLSSKEVVVKVLLDVLPDEELIVRIPYTVSPAGDGGGGGGTLDPWSMALLLVVATGRRRA
ncbi:MAG: hypothetical protein J0M16_11550, partial [Gammaproteobacteria bacterium]|nr:hypothetical protein [Gammaproteobacteria bacterium]